MKSVVVSFALLAFPMAMAGIVNNLNSLSRDISALSAQIAAAKAGHLERDDRRRRKKSGNEADASYDNLYDLQDCNYDYERDFKNNCTTGYSWEDFCDNCPEKNTEVIPDDAENTELDDEDEEDAEEEIPKIPDDVFKNAQPESPQKLEANQKAQQCKEKCKQENEKLATYTKNKEKCMEARDDDEPAQMHCNFLKSEVKPAGVDGGSLAKANQQVYHE